MRSISLSIQFSGVVCSIKVWPSLFSSSISFSSDCTSGQAFLDISYGPILSRKKRITHFTLSLLLPYFSRRLPSIVGDHSRGGLLLKRVSLFFEVTYLVSSSSLLLLHSLVVRGTKTFLILPSLQTLKCKLISPNVYSRCFLFCIISTLYEVEDTVIWVRDWVL